MWGVPRIKDKKTDSQQNISLRNVRALGENEDQRGFQTNICRGLRIRWLWALTAILEVRRSEQ